MSYNYATERENLFTDQGQRVFLSVRDRASRLLKDSGAVRLDALLIPSYDTWLIIACVDRMLELGELVEVPQEHVKAQNRIFTKPWNRN